MSRKILFSLLFVVNLSVNGLPIESASDDIDQYFSPHIVGGINAPDAFAPHMAALVAGEIVTILACGGSIVLPNLILTAAHCIETFVFEDGLLSTFHAVVGATNWNTQGKAVEFKDYYIHPEWDSSLNKNDIGFLVLENRLKMSETVKLVALNFDWVGGEEESLVTGWGRLSNWGVSIYPFQLQLLKVYTLSPRRCAAAVRAASIWWGGAPHVDPNIEICSLRAVGMGLCYGDSGSPLILKETGEQIGIASWAFPCALGVPDMYARVSGFKDYIQYIMKKHQ